MNLAFSDLNPSSSLNRENSGTQLGSTNDFIKAILGGQGSKNDVCLFSKISLSLNHCFLQSVNI